MRLDRRAFVAGTLASLATPSFAFARSLMHPATAVVTFDHNGPDTIIEPSFVEFLWLKTTEGEVHCHLELDTAAFTDPRDNKTYGPGKFRKGSATGLFKVNYGQDLEPTERQFWWPPGAISKQPPEQILGAQGLFGLMSRPDGWALNQFTRGYTQVVPRPGAGSLKFTMYGPGKPSISLEAQHMNHSGQLRFYCQFAYMTNQ